jgi:hypothetical protein
MEKHLNIHERVSRRILLKVTYSRRKRYGEYSSIGRNPWHSDHQQRKWVVELRPGAATLSLQMLYLKSLSLGITLYL